MVKTKVMKYSAKALANKLAKRPNKVKGYSK